MPDKEAHPNAGILYYNVGTFIIGFEIYTVLRVSIWSLHNQSHVCIKLQSTQPISGRGVTNSCANCVENFPPQQWESNLRFFGGASRPIGPARWLALLLIKAGDVETNPSLTTTLQVIWICDICH